MSLLNNADALYLGTQIVDAAYLGATKVWSSVPTVYDPTPIAAGRSVQGDWVGNVGQDGYILFAWNNFNDLTNLNSSDTNINYTTDSGGARHLWATNEFTAKSIEGPNQTPRNSGTWYCNDQGNVTFTFEQDYEGTMWIYCLDYDPAFRVQKLTVDGQVFDLNVNFAEGYWVGFPLQKTAGQNAVLTLKRVPGSPQNAVISAVCFGGNL